MRMLVYLFIAILIGTGSAYAGFKDTIDHSALIVEADYFSNSSFLGRYTKERFPYLSFSFLGETKNGWWFTPNMNHLMNAGHLIDEVDLSLGKDFQLSKKVDATVGYTRYSFHEESPSIRSGLKNNLESILGYQWWAYSTLALNYNFSSASNDLFLVFSHSRSFYFDDIFKKDVDYVRIRPGISFVAGTQEFFNEYAVSYNSGKSSGKGKGKGNNSYSETIQVPETTFGLMNVRFKLPVRYTYKRFNIQAAYTLTVPVNSGGLDPLSIYSISTFVKLK